MKGKNYGLQSRFFVCKIIILVLHIMTTQPGDKVFQHLCLGVVEGGNNDGFGVDAILRFWGLVI
ncbi:T cell receptor alpha chain [Sesbania bispinosa]|nr:T cell receptor alpha chain [Sesbania bispinosa]